MKVSKDWLKELIALDRPVDEVMDLLPKRTIGIKEVTKDFFELDMKGYNRADLLSLRGVAQEIAAITVSRVKGQARRTLFGAKTSLRLHRSVSKIYNSLLFSALPE